MSMKFAARGTTGTTSVKNRIVTRRTIEPRTRSFRPRRGAAAVRQRVRGLRDASVDAANQSRLASRHVRDRREIAPGVHRPRSRCGRRSTQETPEGLARSRWVMPRSRRAAATLAPMVDWTRSASAVTLVTSLPLRAHRDEVRRASHRPRGRSSSAPRSSVARAYPAPSPTWSGRTQAPDRCRPRRRLMAVDDDRRCAVDRKVVDRPAALRRRSAQHLRPSPRRAPARRRRIAWGTAATSASCELATDILWRKRAKEPHARSDRRPASRAA